MRFVQPPVTHNVRNKNFGRLALLYKIISQNSKNNSSFIGIESYQQILPDYENLITSLQTTIRISPILFQVIMFLSRTSHKPVWLTNDLSVVVPSDCSHGYLIDWAKLYIEISFVSSQQTTYISSRLLILFRNDHNVIIIFKNVSKVN